MEPRPFQLSLSGSAGVGKSFLVTPVTEYLRWALRCLSQSLDNPSSTSTGKAATNVNSIALYSAFDHPVKSGLKLGGYWKPSDQSLHKLRNKYQHLKVLIRETFEDVYITLKNIKQNLLPPGNQKNAFVQPSNRIYK